MAPHSSTLAWRIPWMEEPGRLQTLVSLRVGLDWATSLSLFTFMHWRKKWQPTPVFLPGESQGWRSLVGCRLWGRTDRTRLIWLSILYAYTIHMYSVCIYYNIHIYCMPYTIYKHILHYYMLDPGKKRNEQPRQHIKKQRHYFAEKGPSSHYDVFFQ